MKAKLLLLCCLLIAFFTRVNAQQQFRIGNAAATEYFNDVRIDPNDGGTIHVGSVNNGGQTDCYLVKLNAARQTVWQRSLQNAAGNDVLYRVRVCANGDYIATGRYFQNNRPRGIVCRINAANGNIIWATTTLPLNSVNGDDLYDLVELNNGTIAVTGTQNLAPSVANGMVILFNANGVEITKVISNYNDSDEFETLAQMPNGNLLVVGHYWTNGAYPAKAMEFNPNTLALLLQTNYQVNLNVPGVNTNINTYWPSRSYVVGGNILIDMYGVTGAGNGNGVQFVYNYTQGTGALGGRYFYHGTGSGGFTTFPLAANDYVITQSNGAANQFVSRITNGVTIYDRRIANNNTNNISGHDINNGNMVLAGGTPANDAYALFSNANFPTDSGQNCPIVNANTLVNVAHTPANVVNNITFNVNNIQCQQIVPVPVNLNDPITGLCGPPCPTDSSYSVTKCNNAPITLTARPGLTYSWSPATGLSSTTIQNPVCTVTSNTTYTVTITNASGCTYRDIINVNVINCCPLDTAVNVTKCDIEDIVLTARPGTSYSWSPATGLSSTTIQSPTCTATSNTTYTVTITNTATNCTYTDVFNVTVNDCTCEDSCNWSLTGNSFVQPYNFIGPKNNADFKVRTNNIQRMVVTAGGNVGIGTPAPAKLLHVNGEARIGVLPAAAPNDRVVFANAAGDLRALNTTGNTNQYLSGNGTWQTLPPVGGITGADQGLTLDGNTVLLGAPCNTGAGNFQQSREINMDNWNLYFNSSKSGKLYMGVNSSSVDICRDLYTRLEISSTGLSANNDYASPNPSRSGLRFTDLTARDEAIPNRTKGVLSLDEDGDVIWVQTCCSQGGLTDPQLKSILDRLAKLEKEVQDARLEATQLRAQLAQTDVVLSKTNTIILNQNVPNPFAESTTISYTIPQSFGKAQLIFTTVTGELIKTVEIKSPGSGQVNVFGRDLSSGLYVYTLVVDGKQIDRKKMIRQ
jgi:hypothetical protein